MRTTNLSDILAVAIINDITIDDKAKITSDKVEEELSQLWDSGQEWILIFDNLLKHPGGKVGKGCKCDMCEMQKGGPTNNGHGCYNNDSAFESLENSLSKSLSF